MVCHEASLGIRFRVERRVFGRGFNYLDLKLKVCRIMAFYRFWAVILPTFVGSGKFFLGFLLEGFAGFGLRT